MDSLLEEVKNDLRNFLDNAAQESLEHCAFLANVSCEVEKLSNEYLNTLLVLGDFEKANLILKKIEELKEEVDRRYARVAYLREESERRIQDFNNISQVYMN